MARTPKPAHLRQGHRRRGFSVTISPPSSIVPGLFYGRAAVKVLTERWGADWGAEAERRLRAQSPDAVRTLVWAGLLAKNPALTEREVGAMIGGGGFNVRQAVDAITAGLRRSTHH